MKKDTETLLEALQAAILQMLEESTGKDRNDAINAGIKLLAIKNRLKGSDDADYFGH